MVRDRYVVIFSLPRVSVLALSSRFDGPITSRDTQRGLTAFQYSLCRVVLMVHESAPAACHSHDLSVLALSSRFDGQTLVNSEIRL